MGPLLCLLKPSLSLSCLFTVLFCPCPITSQRQCPGGGGPFNVPQPAGKLLGYSRGRAAQLNPRPGPPSPAAPAAETTAVPSGPLPSASHQWPEDCMLEVSAPHPPWEAVCALRPHPRAPGRAPPRHSTRPTSFRQVQHSQPVGQTH